MHKKLINFILMIALMLNLNPLAFGETEKIRVGHFPNVTHAPALIARATKHFEKIYGEGVQIDWKTFNAGPSAIEALFAKELDLL
jgi:NitT/TauT family transport system substrate-binding protein